MLGRRGGDLVAVVALGDDLEPVVGAEDAGDAGAHDRLVVDDEHADHGAGTRARSMRGTGRSASTRQPSPTGPAWSSPPSARARSRMPTRPKCPASGSGSAAGRPWSATTSRTASAWTVRVVHELDGELDAVARCVAGDVGERLPGDAVQRGAHRAAELALVRGQPRVDLETGAPVLLDEGSQVGGSRQRRIRPPFAGPQGGDGRADLVEARPTDGLGVDEGALGFVDVPAQDMSGPGHVEQDGRQRVAGEVVELAGDALPLGGHGRLGERLAGRFELIDEDAAGGGACGPGRT